MFQKKNVNNFLISLLLWKYNSSKHNYGENKNTPRLHTHTLSGSVGSVSIVHKNCIEVLSYNENVQLQVCDNSFENEKVKCDKKMYV